MPRKQVPRTRIEPGYETALADVVGLIDAGRRAAARSVNVVLTATNWAIGRRIAEEEQRGRSRANYGEELLARLSRDLQERFKRGFSPTNLSLMRAFYFTHRQILQTVSEESGERGGNRTLPFVARPGFAEHAAKIFQTVSEKSVTRELAALTSHFPLPWSHYVRLLSVRNVAAREFYETEAFRGGWSLRQLERQIDSQFYERTLLSRNKSKQLTTGAKSAPEDATTPEDEIKDPFVLEFLGLKDEYSESDLEEGLIAKLESFLLELGGDFAFVGRQRRLRVGNEWYRVDLVFFHRRLRCLVIVDLKLGKFTHADAGQMHLYVNYAREHWMVAGENPPVGLILCATKDAAVAHYALEGLPNKVVAAEYRMALPKEQELAAAIKTTRLKLDARRKRK